MGNPAFTHFTNIYTIWSFNIAMENHHAIKNGKPSISMGHLYHGKLLNDQRVLSIISPINFYKSI